MEVRCRLRRGFRSCSQTGYISFAVDNHKPASNSGETRGCTDIVRTFIKSWKNLSTMKQLDGYPNGRPQHSLPVAKNHIRAEADRRSAPRKGVQFCTSCYTSVSWPISAVIRLDIEEAKLRCTIHPGVGRLPPGTL